MRFLVTFIFFCCSFLIEAQYPPAIIKSIDESVNPNVQNVASNLINLKPGYSYIPTTSTLGVNSKMDAYIGDGGLVQLPENYYGSGQNFEFDRTLNTSLPVGSLFGSSNVSATGAWEYSIPIKLTPGIGGTSPQIGLSYSSQSGNSSLGMGWSMAGLSSITRGPKSYYYGGKVDKIQQDNTDVLALDGNVMQYQVGTGAGPLSNGAEYKTFVETFSRIEAFETGNVDGVDKFEVTTKDGVVIEYGGINNSTEYTSIDGNNILAWRISKITDLHGNYIDYKYESNVGGYNWSLSEINYGGNSVQGTSHFCSVKFKYKTREDKSKFYINGGFIEEDALLESIEVWTEGEMVRKYELLYGYNLKSFLYEVIEYGYDGSNFNSTRFKYGENDFESTSLALSKQGIVDEEADYRIADFNGDGLSDIMAFTYSFPNGTKTYNEWLVYLNNGNGYDKITVNNALPPNFIPFDSKHPYTQLYPNNMGVESFDMNGDGMDDVLIGEAFLGTPSYINYRVYFSEGDGTFTPSTQIIQVQADHEMTLGDFDGDRRLDLLIYNRFTNGAPNNWQVFFFDEESNDVVSDFLTFDGTISNDDMTSGFYPIDYDGDGTTEILTTRGSKHCVMDIQVTQTENSNGIYNGKQIKIVEIHNNSFPGTQDLKFTGDFNGDGITDILSNTVSSANNWFLGTGVGKAVLPFDRSYIDVSANDLSLTNPVVVSANSIEMSPFSRRFVIDINGDGMSDIVQLIYDVNSFQTGLEPSCIASVYLSDGTSFKTYSVELPYYFNDNSVFQFGDFDGDGGIDILHSNVSNVYLHSIYQSPSNYLMTEILDGFNNHTEINYKTISDKTNPIYTKGTNGVYPIVDVQVSLYAVSQTATEDGLGGRNNTEYEYEEARVHKKGKGFLGFKTVAATNTNTHTKVVQTFDTDPDFTDTKLINTKVYNTSLNQLISETDIEYEKLALTNPPQLPSYLFPAPKRYFVSQKSTNSSNFINGITTSTEMDYDANGNLTSSLTTVGGGIETQEVLYQYGQFGGILPNKPTQVTTKSQRQGDGLYQRVQSMNYNATGDLIELVADPGHAKSVTKQFNYDAFGNPVQQSIFSAGLPPSTTSMVYDPLNRFVTLTTNTLNHVSTSVMDGKWGVPTKVISIDGLTTEYFYDGFGRLIKTIDPNGVASNIKREWVANDVSSTSSSPMDADDIMYLYHYTSSGSPEVTKFFNSIGAERKITSQGLNNDVIAITTYNERGLKKYTTAPFHQGDPNVDVVEMNYDPLARITSVQSGLGTATKSYTLTSSGFEETNIGIDGKVTSATTDFSGKQIAVTDNGGTLTFSYFSNGNLKETQLDGTTLNQLQYDNLGRQTALVEPNSGTTNYVYNAYGQLEEQTDANGNLYKYEYDQAGRVIKKETPEGIFGYNYVSSGNGLEQVQEINAPNGYFTKYDYDSKSRITNMTENIDGQDYEYSYDYDQYNRMISETYPSGLKITNDFDNKGFLTKVKNPSGDILWEGIKQNAFGTYTEFKKGNGVTSEVEQDYLGFITRYNSGNLHDISVQYDITNGNILSRSDNNKLLTEAFQYDNLDRLTQISLNGTNYNINYDDNGNINEKFDVGAYLYDPTKINAVIEVENIDEEIALMIQDVAYSSFHSPISIEEGDYHTGIKYGVDNQRRVSIQEYQGATINTRIYLGNMERNIDVNGAITDVHYIMGGSGLVSIAVEDANGIEYYTPYQDHLGSITMVTDATATVVFEQNFDAWGRLRNPNDWSYTNVPDIGGGNSWAYRGYTFHEHLPEFGLINMNGRMYDPILGRMLSPDNYIQSPFSTQSYNRYSYVWNNPLKYSDPSGEIVWAPIIIGSIIGAYSGGSLANQGELNPAKWDFSSGKTWGYMAGGAIIGGVSGGLSYGVATSGIPFANTAAIATGSFTSSYGTSMMTWGETDIVIGFGVITFNLSETENGYLFKKGNSTIENIAYGLGLLANISDFLAGFNPSEVQLNTEHSDAIGHSSLTKVGETNDHNSLVSVGPDPGGKWIFNPVAFKEGTNDWKNYVNAGDEVWKHTIKGVNLKRIENYGLMLDKGVNYNLYFSSCVNHTARALTISGVPVLGIHPHILNAQIYLRSIGFRPIINSHYLLQW